MLRIHQSESVAAAKSYYANALKPGDYFIGQDLPGTWHGKTAAMLGLSGEVNKEQFMAMCENRRPDDGGQLNPCDRENRKVGYDITFSAPKSVSILHSVVGDERILEAFVKSVRETMQRIEKEAHVRVRKGGTYEDRKTGNLAWGEFVHFTSRPINGISDPQLHAHCYTFNTSFDAVENRFKAGKFCQIKYEATYYEAVFHSILAEELRELGYGIDNRPFSFEVQGVGAGNIERFSRRKEEIEALAEELGIIGNDKAMDGLGARSRARKEDGKSGMVVRSEWLARLDRTELTFNRPEPVKELTAVEAVDLAIEDCFERRSVMMQRRLIARALQLSLGQCHHREIEKEVDTRRELVTRRHGDFRYTTTEAIIAEEREVLAYLQSTRGTAPKLRENYQPSRNLALDSDQLTAIRRLLDSNDRVFVIEGRAGTGKTTLMREAIRAIEAGGNAVYTFAPTSEAAHRVLKAEGFERSETVQQLLINRELQAEIVGKVVWVDEAGLLSSKEMNRLIHIADAQDARVIFSGDTRQHHSVGRGDALRLVSESGLVQVAYTSKVHRQKKALYRSIVELIAGNQTEKAFARLDEMGAIHEIPDADVWLAAISKEYVESIEAYDSVLVVAPTHAEGRLITDAIRERLFASGKLGCVRISYETLENRNLTCGERKQALNYRIGDVVRFHRSCKDVHSKGDTLRVTEVGLDGYVWAIMDGSDERMLLPLEGAESFNVYRPREIDLGYGDKIRLTANMTAMDGQKLYNGSVYTVVRIDAEANLILDNGARISDGAGTFTHGYVTTSHASQGRTCDKVIISQACDSRVSASLEQFYVSVSRGRHAVSVYTDDKDQLLQHVRDSDLRMSALEFLKMTGRDHDLGKTWRLMEGGVGRDSAQRTKDSELMLMDHEVNRTAPGTEPCLGNGRGER
ncbi:MAG: relaxase domain-containing protein [Verrucomicrobiae bacterium]|nr:relaxase domain-containing protein [Verrucomicrobiae bacterium]